MARKSRTTRVNPSAFDYPDLNNPEQISVDLLKPFAGNALKIEWQHLSTIDLGFNIENISFDHAEIDIKIGVDGGESDPSSDPLDDNIPEPRETVVSQIGDLWLLGKHRLYCGSALDAASFDVLMDGEKASMVFVDAPYNVPVQGHVSGLGKVRHREFVEGSGEMTDTEFRVFLARNAKLLAEHSVDGAILMMCMDWRGLFPLQQAIADAELNLINLAVWAKTNGGMGTLYRSQHELVLITKKGKEPHINNVQLGKHGRYRTNAWRYAGVNTFGKKRMEELSAHPTVKPVAMVADAIRDVSHRGQIVLDSFMGSGTTLLATERTGRIAYGMDLDPLYVDLAVRRWEQMTGGTATLASSAAAFTDVGRSRGV